MGSKKVILLSNSIQSLIDLRLHLLRELVGLGYDVVACAPSPDEDVERISKKLEKIGIRFVKIKLDVSGINPFCDFITFLRLLRLFRKEKPSVVIAYRVKLSIYASLAAFFAGVKNIYSMVTGLGYTFVNKSFKARVARFVVEKLFKIAFVFNKKVFFQNPDDLGLFVCKKLLSKDKAILVNGSGVDVDEYSETPFPNVCTFFLGARLIKDKGVFEYIEAVRRLKKNYPDVRFLLAGDLSPNPSSLTKAELDSLISEGVVEYLGFVSNMKKVLSEASVFVLPSYREGTPRSVLEAMAVGRPIVTADAPGCRETVVDGVNGYLVPVKDVDALVQAMERFILHPELLAKMGEESRKIAEEKYDVNKVNKFILKIMDLME